MSNDGDEATLNEDPLRAFLSVRARVLGGARPFDGGEHLWVGNEGAARAVARLGVKDFGPFVRRHGPDALTYGEIVALSGDFYRSPGDLFDEKPSPLPWLWEGNDLDDIKKALGRELAWIKLPPEQRGTSYPDENVALWWNAKQYTELALQNTSHFGWHNALEYVTHHRAALELAARAAAEVAPAARSLLWRQAVYTNGFADHFLTDGFAAGHVRTPAAQIRRWAAERGMDEKLAGALVKLIHDQDGHVERLHSEAVHVDTEGLHVVNAHGHDWHTGCDGQLFLAGVAGPAVERAVEAVEASVEELLRVYHLGQPAPDGVYGATQLIPWPHPDERRLIEKFRANLDDKGARDLYESVRWYIKLPKIAAGLRPRHIQACFEALPGLMEKFRQEISEQAARLPDEVRHLAPQLVEAYRNIE